MKTNDLKNIWKSEVDNNIKSYSDKELNEMIVRSTHKSIRRIYPSVVFMLIIAAVIVLLIVNITIRNTTPAMRMLDLAVLLILAVSLTLSGQSFLAMRKYKADLSVKNWLEYRIREVEKTLNFNKKYYPAICAAALICALSYYYLFIWLGNIFINLWIIIPMTVSIVIFILFSQKNMIKKYKRTLQELKDLYKQFEE